MNTITLIEANPILLEALTQLLNSEKEVTLKTTYNDTSQLCHIVEDPPDILWLDENQPVVMEAKFITQLQHDLPNTKILLYGLTDSVPILKQYYLAGICAYIPKTTSANDILIALSQVLAGKIHVPLALSKVLTSWFIGKNQKKISNNELTRREKEILMLIIDEFTTQEIARKLYISHSTVETHRINLIQKLGVKNTAGMVRVAIEVGYYEVRF